MHSTEVASNNVPAFLTKLWKLVEDDKCDDLICWATNGLTFIIRNQSQFAKELLPLYFKHNNMASFIRQLNMYGFRKVVNIEQGGLKAEKDEMEFQHQYFLKEHEYLLSLIKRKMPAGKGPEEIKVNSDIVSKVITDVQQLQGRQETIDSKFITMKRENEALWREVANLRQKHLKQQQIVNKLIQFLITLVQPNRGIGIKRKIPLMLNDKSDSRDIKSQNLSRHFSFDSEKVATRQTENSSNINIGPVIHDVTDMLNSEKEFVSNENVKHEVADIIESGEKLQSSENAFQISLDDESTTTNDPVSLAAREAEIPMVLEFSADSSLTDKTELPQSAGLPVESLPCVNITPSEILNADEEKEGDANSIPLEFNTTLANVIDEEECEILPMNLDSTNEIALLPSNDSDLIKSLTTEVSSHVDNAHTELESLRELLANSGYNFNASTLLGLFNNDDPLPGSSRSDELSSEDKNEIIGTELIQYNPSLLELTEDAADFFHLDNDIANSSDYSVLFDNVETVLPELDTVPELTTPDPILTSPNLMPVRKRRRTKK